MGATPSVPDRQPDGDEEMKTDGFDINKYNAERAAFFAEKNNGSQEYYDQGGEANGHKTNNDYQDNTTQETYENQNDPYYNTNNDDYDAQYQNNGEVESAMSPVSQDFDHMEEEAKTTEKKKIKSRPVSINTKADLTAGDLLVPPTPTGRMIAVGDTVVGESGYYARSKDAAEWEYWERSDTSWNLVEDLIPAMHHEEAYKGILEKVENTHVLASCIPDYEPSNKLVNDILSAANYNHDYVDAEGNNFLILSCVHGKADLVRIFSTMLMLDAQNEYGSTALHIACYNKHVEIVQILLNAGADPDVLDSYLSTPLHYAASSGSTSIVAYLLGHHARMDMEDTYGKKPIDYAMECSNLACVQLLKATSKWKACSDPETGYTYWVNTVTGETQWSTPAMENDQAYEIVALGGSAKEESNESKTSTPAPVDVATTDRLEELQRELELNKKELETMSANVASQAQEKIKEIEASIALKEKQIQEQADQLVAQRIAEIQRDQEEKLAEAMRQLELQKQRQADMLSHLEEENNRLKSEVTKEQLERQELHNKLEDLKGKIRVYCRIRPVSSSEANHAIAVVRESKTTVVISKSQESVSGPARVTQKDFKFDSVFDMNSTQEDVFQDTKKLVQSAFDGYNVCIFAYGQTGSGKTFTMTGSSSLPGLGPRAVDELFDLAKKSVKTATISLIQVELYCDKLVDLQGNKNLEIRQDPSGAISILNANDIPVENGDHMKKLIEDAFARRTTSSTSMNANSSRSHMLSIIRIKTMSLTGKEVSSKLTLVDLAGSERIKKTDASPHQIKEAQSINQSLSALGNVINALTSKGKKHVPVRDNKLTLLMSDSLGGNAKTLMFVNVSPVDFNINETENSLNFAMRIKQVKNQVDVIDTS